MVVDEQEVGLEVWVRVGDLKDKKKKFEELVVEVETD